MSWFYSRKFWFVVQIEVKVILWKKRLKYYVMTWKMILKMILK